MDRRLLRFLLQMSAPLLLLSCASPSSPPQSLRRLEPAELAAIEAGAQDLEAGDEDGTTLFYTAPTELDLVSRDEFDSQMVVLARTRSRLEALEAKAGEAETQIDLFAAPPVDEAGCGEARRYRREEVVCEVMPGVYLGPRLFDRERDRLTAP